MHSRILAALLVALVLLAPAVGALPARVFRINPIVGLEDPTFRDNPLSLDDPRLQEAMMDVDLPAFEVNPDGPTDGAAWGNQRFLVQDAPVPPDGTMVRRDDPRFVEQMAFFYLNHAVDRIEALGYTVPFDGPLDVYAHQPPINSYGDVPEPAFNPDANCCNNGLVFHYRSPSVGGDGGTGSSAEDADVVVHEFGHYLHFRLATALEYDPDKAAEYRAYAEGTADLFSVLLNDDLSNGVGDACHAEWINTYWGDAIATMESAGGYRCTRVLDNDLVWPADKTDEGHHDGMFWSGAMWTVRQAIGTEATLRLLLEALPLVTDPSFEGLASAVVLADAALYGGSHEALLASAFGAKGITVPPLATLLGDAPAPEPLVAVAAPSGPTSPPPAESNESPAGTPALLGLAVLAVAFLWRRRS